MPTLGCVLLFSSPFLRSLHPTLLYPKLTSPGIPLSVWATNPYLAWSQIPQSLGKLLWLMGRHVELNSTLSLLTVWSPQDCWRHSSLQTIEADFSPFKNEFIRIRRVTKYEHVCPCVCVYVYVGLFVLWVVLSRNHFHSYSLIPALARPSQFQVIMPEEWYSLVSFCNSLSPSGHKGL